MEAEMQKMGIVLNGNTLQTLWSADDLVVVALNYNDPKYITRKLMEEYKKIQMRIEDQ